MPPRTTSTSSCSTSFRATSAATSSSVALSSTCSSRWRPSSPPSALMSPTTILATLAFASPTNESGPVRSAMTPTLMGSSEGVGDVAMVSSLESRLSGLRPELVPGVEVVDVLAAVHDPAVLELEDDTAVDVQVLAVALGDVVMDADHAAVLVGEHALQIGPERAARLGHVAAETGEDSLPSDDVSGERAPAGGVPRDVVAEEFGEL